jgi:hypothetical protein
VRVRLDRVVASPSWSNWYPNGKVQHLISSSSNHCSVFLSIVQQDHSPHQAKHIMRLEIMWEREELLAGEIKKVWEESTQVQNLGDVETSLRRVMKSLRSWSFQKFETVTKELESIKEQIESLSSQNHVANQGEIERLSQRMDEPLYREEMMWLQRSRIAWLKEGDRNTKFFHRKAANRGKMTSSVS